ncbi:MAG TPA: HAMP domain-containing sensor histidine kinase [Candidatus Sulfotelmatobacter sp.]|nr:HAMP domain-containing sensor histidine kinase [Candidatus Sulfotelmatobacter sp.]
MTSFLQTTSKNLFTAVDWFIPAKLKANSDVLQGARMFLFSHLLGPFLGHTISLYLLFVAGPPDRAWWIFFGAITAFWPFTFVLRATGAFVPLALISIQNLLFCILWGCYHYGGISSPILPWLITVPLLAFFYLPTRRTRIIVSCLIVVNLIAFYVMYRSLGFPVTVPLSKLSGLGIVSTFCAGVYVSMMALYYANIVSSQSELEQEILRHRETERLLREATEQAERATQAKSEFLAKMSHELKNPLNAIIGFSEILIEQSSADDQKWEDLQYINGAGQKLLELINDLLDLSKLEAGKMDLYLERFSLAGVVDEVAAQWRQAITASGNAFHVERPAVLEDMSGDLAKLRKAVSNLLSNAAKFTRNGRVVLTAEKTQDQVVITVRDSGVGIAAEQMASLFETFGSRAHETSSNYGVDPRLGLPLAQRLCRLMGGDLTVESELGRGSCFRIRVPFQLAPAGDKGAQPAAAAEDAAAPPAAGAPPLAQVV